MKNNSHIIMIFITNFIYLLEAMGLKNKYKNKR